MAIFPKLHSARLLLRQFHPGDLQHVFEGLSHSEVIQYYGVSYTSLEDTKVQMDFFRNLEQSGTGIWWAICSAEDGSFYGGAGLNNLETRNKKAEIGIWLLPKFWGRGIMKESIPLVCTYGFVHLGLHRIEAIVETENLNCRKALVSLHFHHEGTLRDAEVKNGKSISLDIFSLLSTDAHTTFPG